jgi:hypothetical protein
VARATSLRVEVGDIAPADELCTTCHLPALVRADLVWLHTDGVTTIGTFTVCTTDGCEHNEPSP